MTELKAYACLEPYENTGAVIFAKSDIEARRRSANEFHDSEIGGMSVKRAPWADKYQGRQNIPIEVMVDHGWHFECCWSGVTIDSDLYYEGREIYNRETQEYELDKTLIGNKPVGFQEGLVFACQEYADEYHKYKAIEKEFNDEQLKYWRGIVLKNFPDAILSDKKDGYMRDERITSFDMKSNWFRGHGLRYVESVHIPFEFPGMKHWAALTFRQPDHRIGPSHPEFTCANGDVEVFTAWAKEQKEKANG